MATGSGKSRAAVAAIYRLIKFGGARRVLFLVDRKNLGEQAEDEFATYRTYEDQRKLTELYTVQRLTVNKIGSSSKVVITTIQRLYSMLRGEPELDPELEEASGLVGEDPGRVQATLALHRGSGDGRVIGAMARRGCLFGRRWVLRACCTFVLGLKSARRTWAVVASALRSVTASLQPFEVYLLLGILYLVLTFSLSMAVQHMEKRMAIQ